MGVDDTFYRHAVETREASKAALEKLNSGRLAHGSYEDGRFVDETGEMIAAHKRLIEIANSVIEAIERNPLP